MRDFMEFALRRYFDSIGWSEDKYYSSLNATSSRILDFGVPIGLNMALGKSISPYLKSAYSISVPDRRSLAFMFTSVPVELPAQPVLDEPLSGTGTAATPGWGWATTGSYFSFLSGGGKTKAAGESAGAAGQAAQGMAAGGRRPYLLFGRLFEDLRLEGLYAHSIDKDTLFVASALSDWKWSGGLEQDDSHINAQVIFNRPEACAELSFNSDSLIIGGSVLGQVSPNWSIGTEVFYTAKERSGGLSLGAKFRKDYDGGADSTLTFVANPVMGHVGAAYATTVAKDMEMATRYDFNVYSFDADVGVGIEYAPAGQDQVLKGKLSLAEGLSLRFDGRIRGALYSLGMSTAFGPEPRPSIGLQVQV
ncbi:Mitochondrial distribution and morphology protein 10 [Polyrhizophydium stewartii]|uniref:Mitochondrial distribution and morphology protein 10 n=1 Tax=Polyrhizophydium stewartii TaxID=2732419 RepID=A0ABR4N3I9_9FUNG